MLPPAAFFTTTIIVAAAFPAPTASARGAATAASTAPAFGATLPAPILDVDVVALGVRLTPLYVSSAASAAACVA